MLVITLDSQAEGAAADAKKEDAPRSPSLLAKLLAPFKQGVERVKTPKSPKKEKKEESKVRILKPCCLLINMFALSPSLLPAMSSLLRLKRLRPLRPLPQRKRKFHTTVALYLCSLICQRADHGGTC